MTYMLYLASLLHIEIIFSKTGKLRLCQTYGPEYTLNLKSSSAFYNNENELS